MLLFAWFIRGFGLKRKIYFFKKKVSSCCCGCVWVTLKAILKMIRLCLSNIIFWWFEQAPCWINSTENLYIFASALQLSHTSTYNTYICLHPCIIQWMPSLAHFIVTSYTRWYFPLLLHADSIFNDLPVLPFAKLSRCDMKINFTFTLYFFYFIFVVVHKRW